MSYCGDGNSAEWDSGAGGGCGREEKCLRNFGGKSKDADC